MAEAEKNEPVTLTRGELKKMLDETAANAAREVSAQLLAGMVNRSDNPDAGQLKGLAEQIALAIAEVSDQGTSRKRVAPEILMARSKAYEQLIALLHEARDKVDVARADADEAEEDRWLAKWRVVAKTYLGDQIVEPWRRVSEKELAPTEIVWRGIPNNALRPLNPIAERLFKIYHGWIGTDGLMKAEASFVTPGGVTLVGQAPAGSRLDISEDLRAGDLEVITDPSDPNATHIRVLGTIAEPARQNIASRKGLRSNLVADRAKRAAAAHTGQM